MLILLGENKKYYVGTKKGVTSTATKTYKVTNIDDKYVYVEIPISEDKNQNSFDPGFSAMMIIQLE